MPELGFLLVTRGYAQVYVKENSRPEEEYLQLEPNRRARRSVWDVHKTNITNPTALLSVSHIPYAPFGLDRDCGDLTSWNEAEVFFKAAGGPSSDPHIDWMKTTMA